VGGVGFQDKIPQVERTQKGGEGGGENSNERSPNPNWGKRDHGEKTAQCLNGSARKSGRGGLNDRVDHREPALINVSKKDGDAGEGCWGKSWSRSCLVGAGEGLTSLGLAREKEVLDYFEKQAGER